MVLCWSNEKNIRYSNSQINLQMTLSLSVERSRSFYKKNDRKHIKKDI